MTQSLGEAFVTVLADSAQFGTSLQSGIENGVNQAAQTVSSRMADISRNISDGLSSAGRAASTAGRTMSTRVTAPIVGLGGAAIRTAMNTETEFAKIEGLVGVTGDELGVLRDAAFELGPAFGASAAEAAEALFFITSAGLRGQDAIDVLQASLQANVVGLGETSTIADLATSAMNAYGPTVLSASDSVDVLTSAVREGKLEPAELASAMGMTLPVASAMGISFNEVGAAFAAMSRTGTNASQAATQLRGIMTSILKPTVQAEEALNEMGLSSDGLKRQIREEGLLSVLETLTQAFEGNDIGAEMVFGNVRALSGVLDLMGANADGTRAIFDSLSDSTGLLEEAFGVASATTGHELNVAMAEAKSSIADLGETLLPMFVNDLMPILKDFAGTLKDLVGRFAEMEPAKQRMIVGFALLLAAVGPVLLVLGVFLKGIASVIGGVGKLITLWPKIVKGLGLLKTAILTNPIFLLGVVIAGLIYLIWRFREQIIDALVGAWEWVKEKFLGIWDAITTAFNNAVDAVMEVARGVIERLRGIWDGIIDAVRGAFEAVVAWFQEWWPLLLAVFALPIFLILAAWNKWGDDIKEFFSAIWGWVKDTAQSAFDALRDVTQRVWEQIRRYIVDPVVAVYERVRDVFRRLLEAARERFDAVRDTASRAWNRIKDAVLGPIQELWNRLTDFLNRIKDRVGGVFTDALNVIRDKMSEWGQLGRDIINGILDGITGAAGRLFDGLRNLARNALDAAKGALGIASPSRLFAEIGSDTVAGFVRGIEDSLGSVDRVLGTLGREIPVALQPSLPPGFGTLGAAGGGMAVSVVVNNPVPEPASESINRQLRKLAAVGVFGV